MDERGEALADSPALAHDRNMAKPRQPDLFGNAAQGDLLGDTIPAYRPPDLDAVLTRLHAILAETRAADSLPWSRAAVLRAIVPHMTSWLPEEEGEQLRLEFEKEMKRLKAA